MNVIASEKPSWSVPHDIEDRLARDGEWEDDETWRPISLAALGGTSYAGRPIPCCWQLSFEPHAAKTATPRAGGPTLDGHDWSDIVHRHVAAERPALHARLHDDSESATCVVWVEDEADCRVLVELLWTLVTTSVE